MELSLHADITARCIELAEQLVEEGVQVMKSEVPVKTGALRASIHSQRLSERSWSIGTDIHYAEYVEHGRGPVFPVTKKALYWPELGHPVKRAGPAEANRFLERTVAAIDGRTLN